MLVKDKICKDCLSSLIELKDDIQILKLSHERDADNLVLIR